MAKNVPELKIMVDGGILKMVYTPVQRKGLRDHDDFLAKQNCYMYVYIFE